MSTHDTLSFKVQYSSEYKRHDTEGLTYNKNPVMYQTRTATVMTINMAIVIDEKNSPSTYRGHYFSFFEIEIYIIDTENSSVTDTKVLAKLNL